MSTRYVVDLCMIIKTLIKRGHKGELAPYLERLEDVLYDEDIKVSVNTLDLVERTCVEARRVLGTGGLE